MIENISDNGINGIGIYNALAAATPQLFNAIPTCRGEGFRLWSWVRKIIEWKGGAEKERIKEGRGEVFSAPALIFMVLYHFYFVLSWCAAKVEAASSRFSSVRI